MNEVLVNGTTTEEELLDEFDATPSAVMADFSSNMNTLN